MALTFEWDGRKASSNVRKHGVSFGEAATVFRDPLSLTISDPQHSWAEDRYVTTGSSSQGRLLVVVHTDSDQGDVIRIISAREPTRSERRTYEEGGEGD